MNKILAGSIYTILALTVSIVVDGTNVNNYDIVLSEVDMIYNIDIPINIGATINTVTVEPQVITKKLSQEEVELISRVVMAEAEDEPLEGKMYVVDTILNRVDSKEFPNTVNDVIYQPHQFSSMWNGRYDRCTINPELYDLINKEYANRTNSNIVYFTADKYGKYGEPAFRVANHYFSNI